MKKDNIISSESTLTSIKKGIQLPSKKTIDAFCEKYDVSRAWLYTGEGLFAKTPSGQIEPSEKDIRDALKNARMQSDSTISKVAPYLQDILVKVKYVPIDAAASFVESLYNTAYEIDSYGVMPEEGEVLDDSYMVFQVRGDSMEPTIPDGAKILARKIEEGLWESASGVVSIVYGKTLSVKRILKNSLFLDNVLTLKADNPKHGQLDVERREIRGDVASITHNKSKDYLIWKKGLLTDYENLLCRVRDLFIFQAYTGISYADLAKFNFKRDVQKRGNKYVILDIRLKTEENYFIVLLSPAMEILKKYDYVLPIISNQQYNLRLKIVADYAGLDRNLTVHMSRHTFATMCLNNGVKMENVSKMLGHTNVRTTQQYAKVLNAEVEKDFEMLERILS